MRFYSGEIKYSSQILRGIITSILITLVGVLLFAFILSVTNLSDGVIRPVNQFIKLISVFFGCFLWIQDEKFILKGGLIGLLSTVLSVLLFSLIAGSVSNILSVLVDIVFGIVFGVISGVITATVRKR